MKLKKTHARNPNSPGGVNSRGEMHDPRSSGTFCSCIAGHPDVILSDKPTCKLCAAGLAKLKRPMKNSPR
jgi:hypothetical protein